MALCQLHKWLPVVICNYIYTLQIDPPHNTYTNINIQTLPTDSPPPSPLLTFTPLPHHWLSVCWCSTVVVFGPRVYCRSQSSSLTLTDFPTVVFSATHQSHPVNPSTGWVLGIYYKCWWHLKSHLLGLQPLIYYIQRGRKLFLIGQAIQCVCSSISLFMELNCLG